MRLIGYTLAVLALLFALLTLGLNRWAGEEATEVALVGFAASVILGGIIFAVSACVRLARGQVKLRPWDAARKAGLLFLIVFGLRALIELILPDWQDDMTYAAVHSAAFAIVYGLYSTAYRKPA